MDIATFWRKADDIQSLYSGRYHRALLTDDEQRKDVADFLSDMEALIIEWHNTKDNKEVK